MDYNKELTKLLEIEPRFTAKFMHKEFQPVPKDSEVHKMMQKDLSSIEVYPDFTQPENFLKLLDMTIFAESEFFFFLSDKTPQNYLINHLLKIEPNSRKHETFKILAQKVEWSYN